MMKKLLFSIVSVLLLLVSCSDDDNMRQEEPVPPTPEKPVPDKVISLNDKQQEMLKMVNAKGQEMF